VARPLELFQPCHLSCERIKVSPPLEHDARFQRRRDSSRYAAMYQQLDELMNRWPTSSEEAIQVLINTKPFDENLFKRQAVSVSNLARIYIRRRNVCLHPHTRIDAEKHAVIIWIEA
jgi:hypothetical protein